jgi:8-oxo-dGTP pyrophosphatase MutT (NUDIX family)
MAKEAYGEGGCYELYDWKPQYVGLPLTYGSFAIIPGVVEQLPAICIKQRDGNGSSPYYFDLPGGGVEAAIDSDRRAAVIREVLEELKMRCEVVAAIGRPLYLPIKQDGTIVRVDCAQAFLVITTDTPNAHSETLSVAFAHVKSLAGFKLVDAKTDTKTEPSGRMAVMIFDGLSILQEPFYVGRITPEIRSLIEPKDVNSRDFILVDGGRYFGRISRIEDNGEEKRHITLYYRLTPDKPEGRFQGSLESLASPKK